MKTILIVILAITSFVLYKDDSNQRQTLAVSRKDAETYRGQVDQLVPYCNTLIAQNKQYQKLLSGPANTPAPVVQGNVWMQKNFNEAEHALDH